MSLAAFLFLVVFAMMTFQETALVLLFGSDGASVVLAERRWQGPHPGQAAHAPTSAMIAPLQVL